MERVRFVSGLFVLLVVAVTACTDGRPERSPTTPPQVLTDSIEAGYERLQRAHAAADTVPPSMRQMRGAMGRMHGQMRRHRQRMQGDARAGRKGRGMHGGQGMDGGRGMHGGKHHHRRQSRVRRDSLGLWEWHQQMMGMHAQMAQMHKGRADRGLVKRHRQMERRHRRMMEALPSEEDTGTAAEDTTSPTTNRPRAVSGADLYTQQCATCHGQGGTGLGPFPPLAGSGWVVGDEGTPIRILLHGLQGRIEVGDRSYNNVMPAFGRRLSNEEIAALLSFIRSSWGNEASAISASEVRDVRQEHSGRVRPWSADELGEEE